MEKIEMEHMMFVMMMEIKKEMFLQEIYEKKMKMIENFFDDEKGN